MYNFIHYQVRDVMTSRPMTIGQRAVIRDVEDIFDDHDFNGLPVVDENQRLIGMLTKLDVLKAFVFTTKEKVPPYDAIMSEEILRVMTTSLQNFSPETPLTRVLQEMIETGHKSFPVVENDQLIGVVAREDILRALRQAGLGQLPERLESA